MCRTATRYPMATKTFAVAATAFALGTGVFVADNRDVEARIRHHAVNGYPERLKSTWKRHRRWHWLTADDRNWGRLTPDVRLAPMLADTRFAPFGARPQEWAPLQDVCVDAAPAVSELNLPVLATVTKIKSECRGWRPDDLNYAALQTAVRYNNAPGFRILFQEGGGPALPSIDAPSVFAGVAMDPVLHAIEQLPEERRSDFVNWVNAKYLRPNEYRVLSRYLVRCDGDTETTPRTWGTSPQWSTWLPGLSPTDYEVLGASLLRQRALNPYRPALTHALAAKIWATKLPTLADYRSPSWISARNLSALACAGQVDLLGELNDLFYKEQLSTDEQKALADCKPQLYADALARKDWRVAHFLSAPNVFGDRDDRYVQTQFAEVDAELEQLGIKRDIAAASAGCRKN